MFLLPLLYFKLLREEVCHTVKIFSSVVATAEYVMNVTIIYEMPQTEPMAQSPPVPLGKPSPVSHIMAKMRETIAKSNVKTANGKCVVTCEACTK